MKSETVLITGASSGIGLELARLFAAEKCRLVLVARNVPKLEELAVALRSAWGVTVDVLPADLSQPGAAALVARQLVERGLMADVLVNNAGFGAHGSVAELGLPRQREMIQLNVAALTELTGLLLPGMIERKRGGILNLASTAAFQPGPRMAVYFASKAYVLSFSEALAEELAGTGVTCACVCPGPTVTNFAAVAGLENSLLFRFGAMNATLVARTAHRAFRRRKVLCVPGFFNWLMAFSVRFTPRWLVRRVALLINS
jgi:short-subunit dehydrogenase